MTVTEDMLEAGLITEAQLEAMREWGYEAGKYWDTDALMELSDIFYGAGLTDKADDLFNSGLDSEEFYTFMIYEKEGIETYYDEKVGLYRETETGRVHEDPYVYWWAGQTF